jgi:hypothetical protein
LPEKVVNGKADILIGLLVDFLPTDVIRSIRYSDSKDLINS